MLYVELWGLRVNVYAQIAGFVGMLVLIWSYQLRRKGFFVVNTLAMAIFLLESCLLYADADTFTGIVLNAAAIVRNLLVLFCSVRLGRDLPVWAAVLLLAAIWAICAFRLGVWYTWLPPVLQTIFTLCSVKKNYYLLKAGALVLEGGNFFYNLYVGAYIGVLRQVLILCGLIAGVAVHIHRLRAEGKRTGSHSAQEKQIL